MKIVETKNAPGAIGPYSQAVVVGGLVYTSGQIPIDPVSGKIEAEGIEEQTRRIIKNLAAVLEAAGSGLDKVVKTTCFLANMDDFAAFNKVYAEYFTGKPARSCVEVARLPKGALAEIEVVAVVEAERKKIVRIAVGETRRLK